MRRSSPTRCSRRAPRPKRRSFRRWRTIRGYASPPSTAGLGSGPAIAWPDGEQAVYDGRADGTLTWPPRGDMGFGYDPVFVPLGREQTFAELDPEEKHRISHRADAFARLVAEQFG